MVSLFKKVYNFREDDFFEDEIVKLKIGNLATFLGFTISTFYTLIYIFYVNSFSAALVNQFFAFLYLGYFYFLKNNKLFESRVFFFFVLLFHLLIIVLFFSSSKSGFHFYYILTVPGCFLFFNTNKSLVRIGIPSLALLFFIICHLYGNSYYSFELSNSIFDIMYLSTIISIFIILGILIMAFQEELKKKEDTLRLLSKIDVLTGINNRRAFYSFSEHMIKYVSRYKNNLGLLIFDIDFFKSINDEYGHDAGDLVLKKIAEKLSLNVRETDCFARFGGEEFIMMLPEISKDDLVKFSEKVKENISKTIIKVDSKEITITASIGITMLKDGDTIESLIKRADIAMYEAKRSGRNKVCSLY